MLSDRLKFCRKQVNLTQIELAKKLNISHSSVNRWEKGEREPSLATIAKIAEELGVSSNYLAFGKDNILAKENKNHNKSIDKSPIVPPLDIENDIVAFQGEFGAYSHLATVGLYGKNVKTLPCLSFKDAFLAVQNGTAKIAVIPIENSLGGRVADIHHLLPESELHIIGEYYLPIKHCLLGVKGSKISDINKVYSHEQALSQCRHRLYDMGIQQMKYPDTAGAAKFIFEEKDMHKGAIASSLASEIYNLEILQKDLEDEPGNVTRFIVLSREPIKTELVGTVKTSFIFYTRNIPAALYKALGGFATNGINFTKLESYVPMVKGKGSAFFYLEFTGHPNDETIARAMEELNFYSTNIRILGSYIQNQ